MTRRRQWHGIVKLQRELAPHPNATVRINNADNSILLHQAGTPELLAWFNDPDDPEQLRPKVYVYACLRGGNLELRKIVDDRDWLSCEGPLAQPGNR